MSMDYAYLNFKYKPFKFYLITILVTWALWFISAFCSYNVNLEFYKYLFLFLGVVVPFTVAMFMIYGSGNDGLKGDFRRRLLNLRLIQPRYVVFVLLLMPVTVVLATAVSLLFGQPAGQFAVSPGFSLSGGTIFTTLLIIILAPTFEELAWRGYGVDSLAKKGRSLIVSTMIFAVLWDVWHWPLLSINGYYHHEIMMASPAYGLNFIVSVIPIAFLHNWVYYRNGRSITVIILFHAMNNLAMSMLQTEQFTKCIVTVILVIVSVIVFWKDRALWLGTQA
jgi:membrane protease YdiL (CAAX protease family)